MRKRRRNRFTWFPTLGTANPGLTGEDFPGREFSLTVPASGFTNTIISPLTFDVPGEDDLLDPEAAGQLVAAVGQEYVVKRIVGKLFLSRTSSTGTEGTEPVTPITDSGAIIVGAGFFVARAGDSDTADTADQPIGSDTLAKLNGNYSPLNEGTIRMPWMWRRTWILGSRARMNVILAGAINGQTSTQVSTTDNLSQFPDNNAEYGSALDGPHFDVKSARRVRQDERLWFAVSGCNLPIGNESPTARNVTVDGVLDFRILGQLRKAHNKSTF